MTRRSKGQRILGAFVLIAALFGTITVFETYWSLSFLHTTTLIMRNSLRGVELVSQMRGDVGRFQVLVYRHIFEKDFVSMVDVEHELTTVRDDYLEVAREYSGIVNDADEMRAWRHLEGEISATQRPILGTLNLSRENRDEEARDSMRVLLPAFDRIEREMDGLKRLNAADADRLLDRVRDRARFMMLLRTALGSVGILATLVIGFWTTRLVKREEQLVLHSNGLEARNRELDAFAGRVAHDLRGPLATVRLAASTVARRTGSDRSTELIDRGLTQMENLIMDLLSLSRTDVEAGRTCDPAVLAAQIQSEFAARDDAQSVAFRVEVAPAQVRCGEGFLREVLWNLADNAVKYRRKDVDSVLEIRGEQHGPKYVMRISDNGIGMSADEAAHAFNPFYRSTRVHGVSGTGLGLSIVQRVIEAHGGSISIDSKLGVGTTFVISLASEPETSRAPIVPAAVAPAHAHT
jgi:signal transduction histidine kinase